MSARLSLSRRRSLLVALLAAAALVLPTQAFASLSLLKPDGDTAATFIGHGGVSTDGFGGNAGQNGTLQAEVPAGSIVEHAFLYAAGTPFNGVVSSVTFAGSAVAMTEITHDSSGTASRADVTSTVSTAVGSGGGITDFAVVQPNNTQGVALVVIYSNPAEPVQTIAVLDGGALPTGDSASFFFSDPLDPTADSFSATLALGITFGYQGTPAHVCGTGQVSNVDVNGNRLTSCAGSFDDSVTTGGLITVGGVGDSINNPPDPNGPGGEDDELYNLVPFLSKGDTSVTITSANPSNDDFIFLAVIAITAEASVAGPGDPTPTPTPVPTATPTPTPTPVPTATATPTPTPVPTATATPTPTPVPTATPTPTPIPTVSPSTSPTATPTSSPAGVDASLQVQRTSLVVTDSIDARVLNMLPNELATFYLHSAPVRLGTARADADGTIKASFPLPDGTALGQHTLVVVGQDADGQAVTLEASITVRSDSAAALPNTALDTPAGPPLALMGAQLLIIAALALIFRRRDARR